MTHLVVFDIDGTLVDSTGFDGALYAAALRDVIGYEVEGSWASFPHVTDSGILDECLRRLGLEDGDGSLRRAFKLRFLESIRAYIADHPGEVRELPGARGLFDELRRHPGLTVAIATGGWRETAAMKLAAAGFEAGEVPVATASDHFDRTEIMRLAERRACLGRVASRRTYFGDGAWDQQACRVLGWDLIAIGRTLDHEPRFDGFSDAGSIRRCLGI